MRLAAISALLMVCVVSARPTVACECWSLYANENTLTVSLYPTLDITGYEGFIIYRDTAAFCTEDNRTKLTPEPLAFDESHTITLDDRDPAHSYRYEMFVVTTDGEERYPYDVCEFIPACIAYRPAIEYQPGPLGYFLGHGYLTGQNGWYEFELCGRGCPSDCWGDWRASDQVDALDAHAAANEAVMLWGRIDHGGDFCETRIWNYAAAECIVSVESTSWSALKAHFE